MKRTALILIAAATFAFTAFAAGSNPLDAETETKAAAPKVELRANQINRCLDASGRIRLQDTPCQPLEAKSAASEAAASAVDVIDLSALPPREIDKAPPLPRDQPTSPGRASLALSVAWKAALFLALAYAVFRMIRTWRDGYALKAALAEPPRRTR